MIATAGCFVRIHVPKHIFVRRNKNTFYPNTNSSRAMLAMLFSPNNMKNEDVIAYQAQSLFEIFFAVIGNVV